MLNPFSVLTSKIFGGLAVALALALAAQTARIEGFLFVDGYKQTLAARDKTIADIATAQEAASAAQLAANEANRQEFKEHSNASDYRAARALPAGRAAADRYADAHRLRGAHDGLPCATPAAAESPPTPPVDGPSAVPDMVAVPRKDFDDLNANTLRLDRIVNDYAAGLIRGGLAEPTKD
jgi:hypothetical protein